MFGKVLFAAVIAGGVFYAYPLWSEHSATACQAVEQRFLALASGAAPMRRGHPMELAVMRRFIEPISGGAVAAAQAKQHYPALPPELGCAAGYWASILDPRVQQAIDQRLR